jgi:hypothetical protein
LQDTVASEIAEDVYQDVTTIDRQGPTRLWGVVAGKANHWKAIQPDDWILFYVGYNKFEYAARVFDTEHNPELARTLWDDYLYPTGSDHPEEPWDYLIHLQEPVRRERSADIVRDALGYKANYDFPGFSKVADHRVRTLEAEYGGLAEFILSR